MNRFWCTVMASGSSRFSLFLMVGQYPFVKMFISHLLVSSDSGCTSCFASRVGSLHHDV
jgi:hypothetical protein